MKNEDITALREITAARLKIKTEIEELNKSLKAVNEYAKEIMLLVGIEQWADDHGVLTLKKGGEVVTLKKDRLIPNLLLNGIPADKVDEIIAQSSVVTRRMDSVEFRVKAAGNDAA